MATLNSRGAGFVSRFWLLGRSSRIYIALAASSESESKYIEVSTQADLICGVLMALTVLSRSNCEFTSIIAHRRRGFDSCHRVESESSMVCLQTGC